jgi:hypothetical protein
MHVAAAHPWLTVLIVAVVVLAPFAARWVRRANRKVNAALRDFQRPAQTPADHELLTYLNEVGPVPELPMGRFRPDSASLGFDFQYDGVAVCGFEDGDAVAVTDDRARAEAAIATWMRESEGIDDEHTIRESLAWMKPQWVVFEWEPEDSECVWLMNTVSEGDDQAVHVYYLPA